MPIVKQIPNHPDYLISEYGDIFSKKSGEIKRKARIRQNNGYFYSSLYNNGKVKGCRIHRLVLMAFDRVPKPHEVCRHLDGNKINNHISNLKWGTSKENTYDMHHVHKTAKPSKGEGHYRCKLSNKQVQEIRDLWNTDEFTQQNLADKYNVDPSVISRIVNKKRRM